MTDIPPRKWPKREMSHDLSLHTQRRDAVPAHWAAANVVVHGETSAEAFAVAQGVAGSVMIITAFALTLAALGLWVWWATANFPEPRQ